MRMTCPILCNLFFDPLIDPFFDFPSQTLYSDDVSDVLHVKVLSFHLDEWWYHFVAPEMTIAPIYPGL